MTRFLGKVNEIINERMGKGIVGLTENSILMTSNCDNKSTSTINLTSFTNNFSENFSKYFDYNATTGILTCKEDGWYLINLWNWGWHRTKGVDVDSTLTCFVNNLEVISIFCSSSVDSSNNSNNNSSPIYLKRGDIVSFSNSVHNTFSIQNCLNIRLIKL